MSTKIFRYFLVFTTAFFLSLFFWHKSVVSGDNAVKEISSLSCSNTLDYKFSELHLPFESAPTPNDREIPNENEQEDDLDSDSNLLADQQTMFNIFDLVGLETWFTQPSSFIQKSSSVPFFVLYHSWKTYLS